MDGGDIVIVGMLSHGPESIGTKSCNSRHAITGKELGALRLDYVRPWSVTLEQCADIAKPCQFESIVTFENSPLHGCLPLSVGPLPVETTDVCTQILPLRIAFDGVQQSMRKIACYNVRLHHDWEFGYNKELCAPGFFFPSAGCSPSW